MYSVFYLKNNVYVWSLITYDLPNAIKRRDSIDSDLLPIIVVGRIQDRDYTIEEMEKLPKL